MVSLSKITLSSIAAAAAAESFPFYSTLMVDFHPRLPRQDSLRARQPFITLMDVNTVLTSVICGSATFLQHMYSQLRLDQGRCQKCQHNLPLLSDPRCQTEPSRLNNVLNIELHECDRVCV
ncbi:hypothetical protein F2P81_009892 [Scophthalmus maximus]|uniref:Uncharacterized protein n=1 Tax=Scophthalmus maximus TaxID=52904 RepID=A0A6A4SY26_SCOMX|nr:hypothetical protein F2P81_009892 [Scophthalmus maximus]